MVLLGYNFLTEEPLTVRPVGWVFGRLEFTRAVCSRCGFLVFALVPAALKKLKLSLREERRKETVVYHARSKRKKKTP